MKNIIRQLIGSALDKAKEKGELDLSVYPEIVIEKPKEEKFGDFSTSVPMILSKAERKKPREIAEILCYYLQKGEGQVASVSAGIVNGVALLDLDYLEDSTADTDMNFVMDDKGHFIEVQGTAERTPFTDDQMQAMVALAGKGIDKLTELQSRVREVPLP